VPKRNQVLIAIVVWATPAASVARAFLENGFSLILAGQAVLLGVMAALLWAFLSPARFAGTRRGVLIGATITAWLDVALIATFVKAEPFVYSINLYVAVIAAVLTTIAFRRAGVA
jgi:hypothetical protein